MPISIDGTQKLVRQGDDKDSEWSMRTVNTKEGKKPQQFVYVLEVNITLSNDLNLPLMSEFCRYEDGKSKEDCELNGVLCRKVRNFRRPQLRPLFVRPKKKILISKALIPAPKIPYKQRNFSSLSISYYCADSHCLA